MGELMPDAALAGELLSANREFVSVVHGCSESTTECRNRLGSTGSAAPVQEKPFALHSRGSVPKARMAVVDGFAESRVIIDE